MVKNKFPLIFHKFTVSYKCCSNIDSIRRTEEIDANVYVEDAIAAVALVKKVFSNSDMP